MTKGPQGQLRSDGSRADCLSVSLLEAAMSFHKETRPHVRGMGPGSR